MSTGHNADPNIVVEKKTLIRDTHAAPLNSLANRIADSVGLPHEHVPYKDPNQGGTKARILVLLDNPSTKAETGSGSGLGVTAQDGWRRANIEHDLYVAPENIPHCSDRGLNSPGGRERFDAVITDLARMLTTRTHDIGSISSSSVKRQQFRRPQ